MPGVPVAAQRPVLAQIAAVAAVLTSRLALKLFGFGFSVQGGGHALKWENLNKYSDVNKLFMIYTFD